MDCVLTFIGGDVFAQHPGVSVYLDSLSKVPGDKFVFTHDLNQENRSRIAAYATIIDVENVQWIVRDRFLAYGNFLEKHRYHNVLFTDSKDVIFTSNPFEYERKKPITLVSEGITHKQSLWNTIDQTGLQAVLPSIPFEDWPVINGGVQLGSPRALSHFCWDIYNVMTTLRPGSTEQALINYMYQTLWKDKLELADPHKDWLCCTGEPIARKVHGYPIDLNTWKNPNLSRAYSIIHQWERIQ